MGADLTVIDSIAKLEERFVVVLRPDAMLGAAV